VLTAVSHAPRLIPKPADPDLGLRALCCLGFALAAATSPMSPAVSKRGHAVRDPVSSSGDTGARWSRQLQQLEEVVGPRA
jgi:hypothetical protein